MSRPLPEVVDASVAAGRRETLEGRFSVSSFTRLDGLLQSPDGDLDVVVKFSPGNIGGDQRGESIGIAGRMRGELTLTCQRCLGPLKFEVDGVFSLICLADDKANPAGDRDVVKVDPTRVALKELIEDELILALPLVPRHDTEGGACREQEPVRETRAQNKEMQKPFAALQELVGSGKRRSR